MAILDALPPGQIDCDVCIVGTGPVGLALARHCEGLGLKVLALEAGGAAPRKTDIAPRKPAEAISEAHAPLSTTTRRAFGGTSWAWSGLCAFFDRTDFEARDYVPHSGWPLPESEITRYYPDAAAFLGCAPNDPNSDFSVGSSELTASAVRVSQAPEIGAAHRDHFERSRNVTVCLDSPVVGLELAEDGRRIERVVVASRGGLRELRPPRVVIAAGGVRSTQLLLVLQRRWPRHFGGQDGPLGRYYMGHLTGWISSIKFHDAAARRFFQPPAERDFVQRRVRLIAARQMSERLLNIAFWPSNAALYDPSHLSGPLSLAFLTLSLPLLGRWVLPETHRAAALGTGPKPIAAHLRNVLREPLRSMGGAGRALRNMVTGGSPRGALAGVQEQGSYLLQYNAEHAPNPASRVTLADGRDELGLPAMKLDLRFSDRDAESVVHAHDVLASELRASSVADLTFLPPPEKRRDSVLAQALDGYHQMGTTRMGKDPGDSVVDCDCRVHGVANLYVASSSVFPTSSHANPTLLATALAIRLAHHLASVVRAPLSGVA